MALSEDFLARDRARAAKEKVRNARMQATLVDASVQQTDAKAESAVKQALQSLTQQPHTNTPQRVQGRLLKMLEQGNLGGKLRDDEVLQRLQKAGLVQKGNDGMQTQQQEARPGSRLEEGMKTMVEPVRSVESIQQTVKDTSPKKLAPRAKLDPKRGKKTVVDAVAFGAMQAENDTHAPTIVMPAEPSFSDRRSGIEPLHAAQITPSVSVEMPAIVKPDVVSGPVPVRPQIRETVGNVVAQQVDWQAGRDAREKIEKVEKLRRRFDELLVWAKKQKTTFGRLNQTVTLFREWINRPAPTLQERAIKAFPDLPAQDIEVILANRERVESEPKLQGAILAGSVDIGGVAVYRTNDTLGKGNLGAVHAGYAVIDGKLRDVAIKIPHEVTIDKVPGRDEKLLPGFQLTAEIAHKVELSNAKALLANPLPGVIQPLAVGEMKDGKHTMICYERLQSGMSEGVDLEKLEQRLSTANVVAVLADAAEGLAGLHDAGLIHGDVKPENIGVVQDAQGYRGKMLDIGSAYRQEMVKGYKDLSLKDGTARLLTRRIKIRGHSVEWVIPTSPAFNNGFLANDLKESGLNMALVDIRALGLSISHTLYGQGVLATESPSIEWDALQGSKLEAIFKSKGLPYPPAVLRELYNVTVALVSVNKDTKVVPDLKQVATYLRQLSARMRTEFEPSMLALQQQQAA